MSVLDEIVATTREEVARRREQVPEADLARAGAERAMRGDFRPFAAALIRPGLSVIAEHKRRSPSAGPIREDVELEDVVGAYERAGAAVLSVLTEGPNFGGQLADLGRARAASTLPILRKDFIVDSYQLAEAQAVGADAVLLIVAALQPDELERLEGEAIARGLATLVEVHNAGELQTATEIGAPIIGINNRDLTTLAVDPATTFELLPRVPQGTIVVAESGFRDRAELDRLAEAGVDAVLIGEALMRSPDIEAACRALTAA
ncbi:MAG: indole-3-glycerol phosphate synthase [Solirubrobacteraceae bacterium]|nr:indole-3-glycerol phosphate synthase [Solirubrobacteraceae bacterium]